MKMSCPSDPAAALAEFLAAHKQGEADIQHHLSMVEEALGRYGKAIVSDAKVAAQARKLEKAANVFVRALRNSSDYKIRKYPGGDIGSQGENSIWRYLEIVDLYGSDLFKRDTPGMLRFGSDLFGARKSGVGDPLELMLWVERVEKRASIATKAFSNPGAPKKTKERRLLADLEIIWGSLKGKNPGRAGESTYEIPITPFEKFVKLALDTTGRDEPTKRTMFVAMLLGGKTQRK